MMFSQFVLNVFNEADGVEHRRKYNINPIFRDAEKNVDNVEDHNIIKIVGGALSMSFNEAKDSYVPFIVMADGSRSFSMEDIDEEAVVILRTAINVMKSAWIRAQLADILWIKNNDFECGRIAVSENLKQFEFVFDPEHWVDCYSAIHRAFDISTKLGISSASFSSTRQMIHQKLCEMDGTDPLFLSLNLIHLVCKFLDNKTATDYLHIVNRILERNIIEREKKIHLVEEAFSVQELLLKKLKNNVEIQTEKIRQAKFYEEIVEQSETEGSTEAFRAIFHLQKAYNIYTKIPDKDSAYRVRKKIENFQQVANTSLAPMSIQYDATHIHNLIGNIFEGLSIQEMIVELGRTVTIHNLEEVKKSVLEEQQKFILQSMFENRFMDEGRTIERIPPLTSGKNDPKILFKHMVRYVTKRQSLGESIALGYAFQYIRAVGQFPISELDFLVDNNPIVPEKRSDIIKLGIHMALTGDMYAAMHVLLPQTEHIFRELVAMCGDTVTFLKEDGTEDYKPLSQLFKSTELHECFDENIIFTFQCILDEKTGANLRNLNAHGLLGPQRGSSGLALCFLCLLIRLLSLYSVKAHSIANQLSKRPLDLDSVYAN